MRSFESSENRPTPTAPPLPAPVSVPSPHSSDNIVIEPIPEATNTPAYVVGRRSTNQNEQEMPGWAGFEEKEIRKKFVRRVYLILMLQLIFSLGVVMLFILEPNVKGFFRKNDYIHWISFAVFFGVMIGLSCSGELRRKFPRNVILLSILTIAMSIMLGTISTYYNTEAVAMAVGICALVSLLVSIFSFHTKYDFTSCGGILCILTILLLIVGLVAVFVTTKTVAIIYGALGSIIFTLYLAYDTQMLMEGKHFKISSEEYVLAVMQLYLDIINIFIYLLLLVGIDFN